MPLVNIKIIKDGATIEQKAELIKGVTKLLSHVLNKNPKMTMVLIDEIEAEDWGVGGETVAKLNEQKSNT
jgi:4-oxalocrotonate tautomerase